MALAALAVLAARLFDLSGREHDHRPAHPGHQGRSARDLRRSVDAGEPDRRRSRARSPRWSSTRRGTAARSPTTCWPARATSTPSPRRPATTASSASTTSPGRRPPRYEVIPPDTPAMTTRSRAGARHLVRLLGSAVAARAGVQRRSLRGDGLSAAGRRADGARRRQREHRHHQAPDLLAAAAGSAAAGAQPESGSHDGDHLSPRATPTSIPISPAPLDERRAGDHPARRHDVVRAGRAPSPRPTRRARSRATTRRRS